MLEPQAGQRCSVISVCPGEEQCLLTHGHISKGLMLASWATETLHEQHLRVEDDPAAFAVCREHVRRHDRLPLAAPLLLLLLRCDTDMPNLGPHSVMPVLVNATENDLSPVRGRCLPGPWCLCEASGVCNTTGNFRHHSRLGCGCLKATFAMTLTPASVFQSHCRRSPLCLWHDTFTPLQAHRRR